MTFLAISNKGELQRYRDMIDNVVNSWGCPRCLLPPPYVQTMSEHSRKGGRRHLELKQKFASRLSRHSFEGVLDLGTDFA